MITLCIKMKDFDGAYGMLNDLEKMNLKPTANMYNALLGGYFRELVSFVSSDAFADPVFVHLKRQDQPNAKSLSEIFNPRRDEALSVFLIDPAKQANLSKLSGLVAARTSSSEDLHERSGPSQPKTANNGGRFGRSVNEVESTRKQDRKHYTQRMPSSRPLDDERA
ncbi:hypothetical protein FEM48_Zijuj05G0121600 [Ziziphus jujuba var. spinosa]|uniref:Uncharacterized protein n=1 Tax=Ziziphus jujuba var. spinosa TaxID=714518 RepID=A0A978VER2_ZIZJJ|nr:hypothetical protein FEM48_Zijuj05G0121600 [Ziziphus jujuba var. spinosa]